MMICLSLPNTSFGQNKSLRSSPTTVVIAFPDGRHLAESLPYDIKELAQKAQANENSNNTAKVTDVRIFPNPIADASTIEFESPKAGHIKIFALVNSEKRALYEGALVLGKNSIAVNLKDFNSGLITFSLETEGAVTYDKAIKVK